MPRVRAPAGSQASPVKSVQIPLNDDRQEKAQRLQNRQAAHTKQMETYKAAASPLKKHMRRSLGSAPSTPQQQDGSSAGAVDVAGTAITPMKRAPPILANFEEWMKLATDNKINAANSWNFALIDYFHDMSLLREGDGVNFQKASCTLDGCVKIYTSRVDSVATETGKLLSGLAESKDKRRKGEEEGEVDDEDGEEGEDGVKKKSRKKEKRSAEATLVTAFDQLRLKKMELEFAVDPLFKKASADFDEGGAKGLLLNHLSIDSTGRIVFDSSDDAQDPSSSSGDDSRRDSLDPEGNEQQDKEKASEETSSPPVEENGPIDIAALGARFFPDLSRLDTQDVCPTLKTFELGSSTDDALALPFLKAPENWRDEHPEPSLSNPAANDDDNFGPLPDVDDDDDAGAANHDPSIGFGEGGEAWARDAALQPQTHTVYTSTSADGTDEGCEVGTFDAHAHSYGVTLSHRRPAEHEEENILNYFDAALRSNKNWAGPEHWKIARIKASSAAAKEKESAAREKRKEKEPFLIDFSAPMSSELAGVLYTAASSNSAISLPKKEWKAKSRNLLPDDKHFHSKDLLRLFLKPKARLGARQQRRKQPQLDADVDEAYWAQAGSARNAHSDDADAGAVQGTYDADFFADSPLLAAPEDEDEELAFADAREHFSPPAGDEVDGGPIGAGIDAVTGGSQDGGGGEAFGTNLVAQSRRLRPEYVQYARVAKKVDVRRLKEEMWRGIGCFSSEDSPTAPPPQTPSTYTAAAALPKDSSGALHFVDIMNNLQHAYPAAQMADISTSYGFICLLHLANEKGLVIENVDGWTDLTVRKDWEAVVTGEGE